MGSVLKLFWFLVVIFGLAGIAYLGFSGLSVPPKTVTKELDDSRFPQ